MKKLFFCLWMIALCVFPLTACKVNVKSDVIDNMSDIRYNIFAGQTSHLSASLMCGMRENPYNYDGVHKKVTEFGVVTVSIKNLDKQESYNYTLNIGDNKITGFLEENPYDHTFMTDIEKIIDCENAVYLSVEGVAENVQLICESKNWQIQYKNAIDIAYNNLEQDFVALYDKKKFKAECYLKIVHDQNNVSNPYYWCFMVVGQNGEAKSVIIDVNNGLVVTKSN